MAIEYLKRSKSEAEIREDDAKTRATVEATLPKPKSAALPTSKEPA